MEACIQASFFVAYLTMLSKNTTKSPTTSPFNLISLGAFVCVLLATMFVAQVHAHPQDEYIILDIEQGELQLNSGKVDQEYLAALKRKRLRQLAAMDWQVKFQFYLKSGFEHIIPKGLDHILFVLGLFFASILLGALFWQITAFTLAHSITLGLATMGLINVSTSLVEPLIALSIVWVAIENCLFTKTKKWRPLIVFSFGLLHGLGFAAVLTEFGLPKTDLVSSLLAFNIGVELGQLTIIFVALLTTFLIQKKTWYRQRVQIPVSIVIGLVGCYWFVERVFY
jgi:hypothetical protein